MKILAVFRFLALLLLLMILVSVKAQYATREEAKCIAGKWIQVTIDDYGDWNGLSSASVDTILDFKSKNRLLGYFCKIKPSGYIIVSHRKEFAAVKAYSTNCSIDPEGQEGLPALLKSCMLNIIQKVESKLGPLENVTPISLDSLLEVNYSGCWDYLFSYQPGTYPGKNASRSTSGNYQEGEILLSSVWHQHPPYNNDCPNMGCANTSNACALVGCTATAGAQIMKYWSWPPYGWESPFDDQYDWPNMEDTVTTSSPASVQAAVAELNHEIGIGSEMDYGCAGSGAFLEQMEEAYDYNYRYHSDIQMMYRVNYYTQEWFNLIKEQINVNRPIHYAYYANPDFTGGHSTVIDGWKETGASGGQEFHINYGWPNVNANTWYTMDPLPASDPETEQMIINIFPANSLSSPLSGTYFKFGFPYRYFDRDTFGTEATFSSGQYLQSLPGISITGNGTSTYIHFLGSTINNTHIFTNGDISRGILISNGEIRLKNGGQLTLYNK